MRAIQLGNGRHQHDLAAAPVPLSDCAESLDVAVERPSQHVAVLHVSGELDGCTVERLQELLHHRLTACMRTVVLDLSGVTFFNTAGLDLLQQCQQRAEHREVSFRVVRDRDDRVLRVLEVLDLVPRFLLYPSVEQALRG